MRNATVIFAQEEDRSIYDHFQFSPAVKVGSTVYISGVIGSTPKGTASTDAAEEYHAAFRSVERLLAAAGATMDDIVSLDTFHVSNNLAPDLEAFNRVRAEYMHAPHPAWTAIGVSALAVPGARVEIRVTAALPPAEAAS